MITLLQKLKNIAPQITILKESSTPDDKVTYRCEFHPDQGDVTETLKKALSRKFGCAKCGSLLNKGHSFKIAENPLKVKKINEISGFFNHRYDYSKFTSTDTETPSIIICPKHGEMTMSLTEHVLHTKRKGCNNCAGTSALDIKPAKAAPAEKQIMNANIEVGTNWMVEAKSLFRGSAI